MNDVLSRLPPELSFKFLLLLSGTDLTRLSMTNKHLHDLICRTPAIQYHMSLDLNGLRDNPLDTQPLTTRLPLLYDYVVRWRTLTFRSNTTLLRDDFALFRDAFFQRQEKGNAWTTAPLAREIAHAAVYSWEEQMIMLDGAPVYIDHVALDAAADLLVLVERRSPPGAVGHYLNFDYARETVGLRFHLRSLSSRAEKAHPDCTHSVLDFNFVYNMNYFSVSTQIVGKKLLVSVSPGFLEAHRETTYYAGMWDWERGEVLLNISGLDVPFSEGQFFFLTPDLLLVLSRVVRKDEAIASSAVHILDLTSTGESDWEIRTGTKHALSLCLPHLAPRTILRGRVISGPIAPQACTAFIPDPNERLLVFGFGIRMTTGARLRCSIALAVKQHTIEDILSKHTTTDVISHEARKNALFSSAVIVPWDEWGPTHTRAFVLHSNNIASTSIPDYAVYGSRAVLSTGTPRNPGITHVVDFSAPNGSSMTIPASTGSDTLAASDGVAVREPTVLEFPGLLQGALTTALPYWAVQVRVKPHVEKWILGANGIVEVERDRGPCTISVFSL
ncbi:hypothetical protein DENSPDRAFT_835367 [Dentipellis sp. KUC8613]|nr:hypothetical protein DENSPDRAFT_835367 [Dentipellis sp. KUC8613]